MLSIFCDSGIGSAFLDVNAPDGGHRISGAGVRLSPGLEMVCLVVNQLHSPPLAIV